MPTLTPAHVRPTTQWVEYHRDAARSGVGPAQPALRSPRVAWTSTFDGDVYASPLIIDGRVIAVTENDSVYSIDLFTGAVIWRTHLGEPVLASLLDCGNISPFTGITSTPAADPASHRVYVVAFLTGMRHVLFGLDLSNGSLVLQQDIDPPGSNPAYEQQRGALSLADGIVYVPFGGLWGDCGPYHGYLVAVPVAGGRAQTYVVPSVRGAGIWNPQGATIGRDGSVYLVTGNGASTTTFDYSNAVVQLSPDLKTVRSFFAPTEWVTMNTADSDLGSVGVTVLPDLNLVAAIGKPGVFYLLRSGNLGGVGGELASDRICTAAWGGTAWSGSTVYVPCLNDLKAVEISGDTLRTKWSSGRPRMAPPIVTAGAVWGIDPFLGSLYALSPSDGAVIYSVRLGDVKNFSTPAATEGYVVAPAGRGVTAIEVRT